MNELVWFYIAYAFIWAGTFAYLGKLQYDYYKIKRDIDLLSEVAEEGKGKKKKK